VRELHVVATSEDGRHVVLATRKGALNGDYRVAIDERLSAAVRGDLPRPGETEPAVVTPKEIQARLRAGESTEQIAASAGVPVAKIERYAGPVLSERERVLDQARAGFVSRSRLGESALPLGEAVDRHLADTVGVRLETVEWSARREESGTWLVELSYISQARRRSAIWRYDVARREVTATDAASAALAHVEPGGRRSRSPEHELALAHLPARRTSARTARRAAPAKASKAAKAPRTSPVASARTVAARPTAPARVAVPVAKAAQAEAARKAEAAEQKAAAEAARKAKAAAEQKAAAEAARKAKAAAEKKAKAAAEKKAKVAAERKAKAAAEKKAKAAAEQQAAQDVPPGPPTLRVVGSEDQPAPARRAPKQPPAAARTAPARAAGQRASVPGWADVLLSTAPVARSTDAEPDED
jgi:hypothetical protein